MKLCHLPVGHTFAVGDCSSEVTALRSDCYTEVPLYTHVYKVYVCTLYAQY